MSENGEPDVEQPAVAALAAAREDTSSAGDPEPAIAPAAELESAKAESEAVSAAEDPSAISALLARLKRSASQQFNEHSFDITWLSEKKTWAQSLVDLALLTANFSQLKNAFDDKETHEYFALVVALLFISIGCQVAAGVLGIYVRLRSDKPYVDNNKINNIAILLAFAIVVDNVIIGTFDASEAKDCVTKETDVTAYGNTFVTTSPQPAP